MSKKIVYSAADRNKTAILLVLQKHFKANIDGKVLEVSSGTGQHIAYFAPNFPRLTFQPTEFETSLFESINAYAKDVPTLNVKLAVYANVNDSFSKWGFRSQSFDYALNFNMMHVTPFSSTVNLFRNVSAALKNNGLLITYGPYSDNGVLEPQSNKDFDECLRRKDPSCGVRDIQDLRRVGLDYNMNLVLIHGMPANNKCLVFQKNNGK